MRECGASLIVARLERSRYGRLDGGRDRLLIFWMTGGLPAVVQEVLATCIGGEGWGPIYSNLHRGSNGISEYDVAPNAHI
jgi:hypothetical protein